jgi:small-conductance mechanosensitive channel
VKYLDVVEAFSQVFVGTVLIFISNLIVFAYLGLPVTYEMNAVLVSINTVVALFKSYSVRYFFKVYETSRRKD